MDIGCTSKPLIARDADIEHALIYLQPTWCDDGGGHIYPYVLIRAIIGFNNCSFFLFQTAEPWQMKGYYLSWYLP